MRIKKYIAPTMKQGLAEMRRELGDEAVLLSSRTIPATNSSPEMVEVVAALDEHALQQDIKEGLRREEYTRSSETRRQATHRSDHSRSAAHAGSAGAKERFQTGLRGASQSAVRSAYGIADTDSPTETATETRRPPQRRRKKDSQVESSSQYGASFGSQFGSPSDSMPAISAGSLFQLQHELGELKSMVKEINENVKYRHSAALGPVYGSLYKVLRNADCSEDYSLSIIGMLSSRQQRSQFQEPFTSAGEILTESIQLFPQLRKQSRRQVAAFVGPTGSGKTTALAKLAVITKILFNANVLVISADTHKVGGVEQLQTLASIAGIPFHTSYNAQDMRALVQKETERDFIFIDTVGRSYSQRSHITEIGGFLEAATPDITYLVQSATSSASSFLQSSKGFGLLAPSAMILTKLDEASTLGGIAESLRAASLPLAYFSTGQRIPDDLEPAGRDSFAKRILESGMQGGLHD